MNDLRRKILDTQDKSIKLRMIALNTELPKEKTAEIRKEQDELYKKCDFYKKLDSALRKG